MVDVEDAIRDWGRYSLVYERQLADLIIVVRKGRTARAQQRISIHGGSNRPSPSLGHGIDADAGDPQDKLAVYNAGLGIDSAPIWRDRMTDGLNGPQVKLLRELRTKVEAAARNP